MHLHRTYNRSFINVTERVWRQVVQLADWVEYHKYSQATVGSMGGGVLANEIAANFKKSKDSKGSRRVRRDDSLGSGSSSLCTQLWLWKFQVVAQDRGKVIETELSCGEVRKKNTSFSNFILVHSAVVQFVIVVMIYFEIGASFFIV